MQSLNKRHQIQYHYFLLVHAVLVLMDTLGSALFSQEQLHKRNCQRSILLFLLRSQSYILNYSITDDP
jgi:hypothetical protein